jgi:hypothetical protein
MPKPQAMMHVQRDKQRAADRLRVGNYRSTLPAVGGADHAVADAGRATP